MKIRKILLIDPPFFRFMGERQSATPLGLAYIAGVLVEKGFEVSIYNADFDHRKQLPECNKAYSNEVSTFDRYKAAITDLDNDIYSEVISTISDYHPDLIGITVRTGKFFISKVLVQKIKREFPETPVVIGGNHVTADPEHSLMRTEADYAVRGEGEYAFYNLVKSLQEEGPLSDVESLSYRNEGKIIHNTLAALIPNLDEIPLPNRDVIMYGDAMDPDDFGNIFSSRGCPFGCAFCDSRTTWSRKVRRRSAKNIVDEIVLLKEKYGVSFFSFSDDCFVTRAEDAFAFCDEIDRRGLSLLPKKDFRWWCELHPRVISEELIMRVKKSGCVAVAMGVESGSQRTLTQISKKSSLEVVENAAKIVKSHDINLATYFMIGFPWEKEDDIKETIQFMKGLKPDSGNISILTPLPKTDIYNFCFEKGLIDYDDDFLNFFHQRNARFYSLHINEEQSMRIIRESFEVVDDIVEGARKRKIENTISSIVARKLENDLGVKLLHADQKKDKADLLFKCDQRYADYSVDVVLSAVSKQGGDVDADKVKNIISSAIFNELPQYKYVHYVEEL